MQEMPRFCRRVCIVVTAAVAAAAGTISAPAVDGPAVRTKSDLRKNVRRLIGDLGSQSRRIRVRAERGLIKLGPPALPHLPPPELLPNVSVREAVHRVRVLLEHTAAQQSVEPSRVTLSGRHTLSDVLAGVTKQTGNVIDATALPAELRKKTIAVDYRRATFWEVLHDLSQRAAVTFDAKSDGGLIVHKASPSSASIAVETASAYRIAVTSLQWRRLPGDDKRRLLRVKWTLTAEPRLRPLFVKFSGKSIKAHGSQPVGAAKRLAPFSPEAKFEIPVATGNAPLKLRSDFIVPNAASAGHVQLSGTLNVLTAAGQLPITFRDLSKAKGLAKRRGGMTLTIHDVKTRAAAIKPGEKPRDLVSVSVAVAYDTGGPAFESHRTWVFHNRVFLKTADGKQIDPRPGFSTSLQRDGAVGLVYTFAIPKGAAAKTRFVYVAPTLLIDVPVTLKFDKIPLPKPPARTTP